MKKILVALVFCFAGTLAFAQKPLTFLFLEDISYDDNIYLTKENKKGSSISSTQLFAKYMNNIPNTGLSFGANANVGYSAYSETPSKNDFMNAGLGVKLSNKNFMLKENFLYTADPANSELTDRAERMNNTASFDFRTSLEKMFSIGFSVTDIYDKYVEEKYEALNRNRLNAGAQIYYNLSPKTSFYAGYVFSAINYKENKNNNSSGNSGIAGVNGQISAKVKGTAQVSYDTRNYDDSLESVKGYSNLFGYLLSLNYEPTSQNSFILSGERKMEETIFANNRYYISSTIGLMYKQKIYQKWEVSLLLAYENAEYPETVNGVDRTDNLFKVRPGVSYSIREYLVVGAWYQFRDRHSNYDGIEYDNGKAGISVKLFF